MMRAIILLGHGSRMPQAGKDMETIVEALQAKHPLEIVEYAYMSQRGPHFGEVLEKSLKQGAREVLVVPYFLHVGVHLHTDIPQILAEQAAAHPNIKIVLGKNLGFDPCLIDLVEKRIAESSTFPVITADSNLAKETI